MKKGEYNSNTRGFTIIEVALVIAIAGLIFLMVFVALPGLRASQRDAERREDVVMFLENVKKYQTNNRGALPGADEVATLDRGNTVSVEWPVNDSVKDTSWAGFYKKYLGTDFVDPNGEYYKLLVTACDSQADIDCVNETTSKNMKLNSIYSSTFPNDYTMYVVTQAACMGDRAVGTSNPRKLAVLYKLEGAGIYCANL